VPSFTLGIWTSLPSAIFQMNVCFSSQDFLSQWLVGICICTFRHTSLNLTRARARIYIYRMLRVEDTFASELSFVIDYVIRESELSFIIDYVIRKFRIPFRYLI
jgi:hypothetical protein